VKQMNHRGRKGKFQRDVVTNLDKHFVSSNKCLLNQSDAQGAQTLNLAQTKSV
jgi:hypothetical protein